MIGLRWLVIGLLALPFVELALFSVVAGRVGFLGALLAVVATSVLGVLILRGGAKRLFAELGTGRPVILSGEAARDGVLTAFAGLLLAIPGFATDLFALAALGLVVFARLTGGTALAGRPPPGAPQRTPAEPGVVDLDPADWREDKRRDPGRPRIEGR